MLPGAPGVRRHSLATPPNHPARVVRGPTRCLHGRHRRLRASMGTRHSPLATLRHTRPADAGCSLLRPLCNHGQTLGPGRHGTRPAGPRGCVREASGCKDADVSRSRSASVAPWACGRRPVYAAGKPPSWQHRGGCDRISAVFDRRTQSASETGCCPSPHARASQPRRMTLLCTQRSLVLPPAAWIAWYNLKKGRTATARRRMTRYRFDEREGVKGWVCSTSGLKCFP